MYRFISWNVNGLRACAVKGFAESFENLDADFFCLQETKMQAGQLDLQFLGYQSYWNYADKKGYSGTAIYTRHTPLNVTYGIGIDEHDHEGRVITLEMEQFYLVTCYTPNSQDGLKRLDYRMRWENDFQAYLRRLDQKKPVILCGDLNVAHEDIDLKNPKTNRKNAGFSDEERQQMSRLLGHGFGLEDILGTQGSAKGCAEGSAEGCAVGGFVDSYRELYPDMEKYSWWSYRFQAREKNAGWRIDYFIVSERLRGAIKEATIHNEIFGSDHCPVGLELAL